MSPKKRPEREPLETEGRLSPSPPVIPGDGDILIREEVRQGRTVYVLYNAAGAGQYMVRKRAQAVMLAVGFAQSHEVRAWMAAETSGFVPLQPP